MTTDTLLKREQLAKNICAQLNNFVDLKNILLSILSELKDVTGFEAVSIRLKEDSDYPYFVYNGFENTFIKQENNLCNVDTNSVAYNKDRKPQLDCLCGNVILGKVDKSQSYYTPKGSYWTNSSTLVSPLLKKNESDTFIRNHCNARGYESIGLFPIKTREDNIGLIQLNDRRKDMFTTDIVEFLEMIGEQIGVAIENAILYDKIKEQNIELQNTVHELTNMQNHLLEAKKMTTLTDLVIGVTHEIYDPINDALAKLENVLNASRSLTSKETFNSDSLNNIIAEEKEIYYNLNMAKGLVKSFRSLAMDQFQQSRHLIHLHSFFQDIIRVIKPTLKNKTIDFRIECNEHSEILGFSGVLSQTLTIFIQNSYNHAFKDRSSGQITIGCSVSEDDFLQIKFSDNGCGIEKNVQHKIFEPFFTTDRKHHTGLGLSIASNLVSNKLKGTILLEDSSAKGSTFVIKIPI